MPRDAVCLEPLGSSAAAGAALATDDRFRVLMGDAAWNALPDAIRRRFSQKAGPGESILFRGAVTEMRTRFAGRVLAHVARLIGAPLPLTREIGAASVVTVTEDAAGGGQNWTRLYAHSHGFPQIIHSAKRFNGPTGLEEYVGRGVGMTLTVHGEPDALVFNSDRYFVEAVGRRIYLPGWLSPGALAVRHRALSHAAFAFELTIRHPMLGRIFFQKAVFEDTPQ